MLLPHFLLTFLYYFGAFKYNDTMKRILLHDIGSFYLDAIIKEIPEDIKIVEASPAVSSCNGCYGCWLDTPGLCVIQDQAHDFAYEVMDSGELIVISRLGFGTFSPEIKAYLDRMIPCLLPFFEMKEGRMRHPYRSKNKINLRFYFYTAPKIEQDEEQINVRTDKRHLIEVAANHEKNIDNTSVLATDEEKEVMHRHIEAIAANIDATSVYGKYVGEMHALSEVIL